MISVISLPTAATYQIGDIDRTVTADRRLSFYRLTPGLVGGGVLGTGFRPAGVPR